MQSLHEYIAEARKNKTAIGHFNVSTIDGIWAVADAAYELKVPVIVGVSEGERDFIGVRQVASIIKSIREDREQSIFLNADHSYSLERVKEAVLAGFDSVIFDGASLDIVENIDITKKCVDFAKSYKSACGEKILIEGELGFIGNSSKVLDSVPDGVVQDLDSMTKPEVAKEFVDKTGVDLLAPAIGNVHGVVRGGDPALNIGRAIEISKAVDVPLVLHGASGNTNSDIKKAIQAGFAIVHVNTELRIAYRNGLTKSLSEDLEEISPYKYLKSAKQAMQKVIEEKIHLFATV